MRIRVLFDKAAENKKLHSGWGVSFLVDDKILFDTAEKGGWLLDNLCSLGVAINTIEAVVISHDHWDHWGGLWDLLKIRKGLAVYSCPGFSKEFKEKVQKLEGELSELHDVAEIAPDIFTTGEIPGTYHEKYMPEQALVVKTKKGFSMLTGCAHPGIVEMIKKVKVRFSAEYLYFVSGGFHLMESDKRVIDIIAGDFKKMGVIKAGPTHCSGEAAEDIFKKYYGENFVVMQAGKEIEV